MRIVFQSPLVHTSAPPILPQGRLQSTFYREAGRRAGHSADKLIIGLHAIGFLGDTTQQAADDFYPGYAHTFTEIGKERDWPPATRTQFDALR